MAGYQAPAAGLFITHARSPRIRSHFRRLVAETQSLVSWRVLYNPGPEPSPVTRIPYTDPALVMPTRFEWLRTNGDVGGGHLDVAFIPCVLALRARHVWVMEYDVDYSGSWRDFFSRSAGVNADVLTPTLGHQSDCPNWNWWSEASAPEWVDRADFLRGFHPLMRLSRRFAHRYAVMMADSTWRGHYEFTIPTAAIASGSSIKDLGGPGRFNLEGRPTVQSP